MTDAPLTEAELAMLDNTERHHLEMSPKGTHCADALCQLARTRLENQRLREAMGNVQARHVCQHCDHPRHDPYGCGLLACSCAGQP